MIKVKVLNHSVVIKGKSFEECKANDEQIEEFFGYAPHGFSREEIEDNLRQMPDDVFDELVKEFGLPTDGVKL